MLKFIVPTGIALQILICSMAYGSSFRKARTVTCPSFMSCTGPGKFPCAEDATMYTLCVPNSSGYYYYSFTCPPGSTFVVEGAGSGRCYDNSLVSTTATTLDPTATTLDPTATTLDPTATTLDPTATTLDPTATTLDPTAATLDPTATTLDPTATTLDPTAMTEATTFTNTVRPLDLDISEEPSIKDLLVILLHAVQRLETKLPS